MEADVALLQSGGRKDCLFSQDKDAYFDPILVDRTVRDGEKLQFGDVQLTAHWTPGHTKGCTTWESSISVGKKTYNVVFDDCMTVNPGTRFTKNPSYPGIAEDYKRTFRVLESLHPDVALSYHTEFFYLEEKRKRMSKEGVKVWVNPEGYRKRVAERKKVFEALLPRN